MSFWRGETLRERLGGGIVTPFDERAIDCAAYMLSIGGQVFVSPDDTVKNPLTATVKALKEGEYFTIPPGQFAYLLTEEVVHLPPNVLGFISMKTVWKWKGLVNVSGFHVDPGFHGCLTFAVFNAGQSTVHLKRGQQTFLIWFADMDGPSEFPYVKKEEAPQSTLPVDRMSGLSGPVLSLYGLDERLKATNIAVDTKLKDLGIEMGRRVHDVEKSQVATTTKLWIFGVLIVLLVGNAARELLSSGSRGGGRVEQSVTITPPVTSSAGPAPAGVRPAESSPADAKPGEPADVKPSGPTDAKPAEPADAKPGGSETPGKEPGK